MQCLKCNKIKLINLARGLIRGQSIGRIYLCLIILIRMNSYLNNKQKQNYWIDYIIIKIHTI